MTIISNPVTGPVLGQPIHPNFGQQFAGAVPANNLIPQPGATITNSVQKPLLDSVSRGEVPMNAMVASVAGVGIGAGDNASIAEAMSAGNAGVSNTGAAIAGSSGNPAALTTAGINNQIFVDGVSTAAAALATGPAPTDVSTLTQAPVSGATLVSNVALVAAGFQG